MRKVASYPGGGESPKGPAVRRLKGYASWVQNVVNTAFFHSNMERELTYIGEVLLQDTERCKGNTEGRL